MEFGHVQVVHSAPDFAFRGLSPAEQRTLTEWLAASRRAGIDAAEDLGSRPWPSSGAETIIGIFKAGHLLASWLVVGQAGSWAVACCADGAVSGSCDSLAEALSVVCPSAGAGRH